MTQSVYSRPNMTPTEKANADLVIEHFRMWNDGFDPVLAYGRDFAPDARCRAESNKLSPVQWDMGTWHIGTQRILDMAAKYTDVDMTVTTTLHDVFAAGCMVSVNRTDLVKQPGMDDRVIRALSNFIIINGKIVEWSDWFGDRDETGDGAG